MDRRKEGKIMALTLSEQREKQQQQRDSELLQAIEFELVGSIGHAGGLLTGFSVRFGITDCLLTLRAEITSNSCVAFVGAPTLGDCFRKAVVSAYHDELRWKEDDYSREQS